MPSQLSAAEQISNIMMGHCRGEDRLYFLATVAACFSVSEIL